jgi:hypothetical protein
MQDNDYRVVGKPVPRIDGKVKVTGTATFADDLFMPRMLPMRMPALRTSTPARPRNCLASGRLSRERISPESWLVL